MERSSKRWSRSPSGKLWLPEPSRRTVLSGATMSAAAVLLGCNGGSSKGGTMGGEGGDGAGTGGSGTGGSGTGGSTGGPDAGSAGTGGAGGTPDAASLSYDAAGPADALLQSDGLIIAPDGSLVPVDSSPGSLALKCTKRNEQIVGPYPAANVQLDRSDVRSDPGDGDKVKPGVPLQLVLRVGTKGAMGCNPLEGAVVNLWQCDAAGVYASYASQGTAKNQYLRGYQTTDGSGVVVFQTIYPGSYSGRCVHLHFSVRMNAGQSFPNDAFVGQLYFPEAITDEVLTQPGYTTKNRVRNAQDGFYASDMLGTVTRMGNGYLAELELAV